MNELIYALVISAWSAYLYATAHKKGEESATKFYKELVKEIKKKGETPNENVPAN